MEFTIQVPSLARMRRLAIGLSVVLVLIAVAIPASAAAPEGIEGEVTVVNGADQPVPITGDVTADVTGSVDVAGTVTVGNEATDPVPVSGDVTADVSGSVGIDGTVAATQSGAWTVGLDATSQSHLADIDAATESLSYDPNGNLNVNIAAGEVASGDVVLSEDVGTCVFGAFIPAGGTATLGGASTPITGLTIATSESLELRFTSFDTGNLVWGARVDATGGTLSAGNTFSETFPFPLAPSSFEIRNLSDVDGAFVWLCATTLG